MKRADPTPIIGVVSNHNMDDALDEVLKKEKKKLKKKPKS
jgi:hypothetical protein